MSYLIGKFIKNSDGNWQYQTIEKDNLKQDMTIFCEGPLGNWHPSVFHDPKLSLDFTTVEQYFMLHKALTFGDQKAANKIMTTKSAQRAKIEGRSVQGFDEYIWNNKRHQVMLDGCIMKFAQNTYLNEFLQATKDSLIVEANSKDKVWSCGYSVTDPRCLNQNLWIGQNLLGKVLMEVRSKLRREEVMGG